METNGIRFRARVPTADEEETLKEERIGGPTRYYGKAGYGLIILTPEMIATEQWEDMPGPAFESFGSFVPITNQGVIITNQGVIITTSNLSEKISRANTSNS